MSSVTLAIEAEFIVQIAGYEVHEVWYCEDHGREEDWHHLPPPVCNLILFMYTKLCKES